MILFYVPNYSRTKNATNCAQNAESSPYFIIYVGLVQATQVERTDMIRETTDLKARDHIIAAIVRNPLFKGVDVSCISMLLTCLKAYICCFDKGEYIYRHGDIGVDMGIVIVGSIRIENVDVQGTTTVLSRLEVGQGFAEAYACLPYEPLQVDVVTTADAEVLFLEIARLTQLCSNMCQYHQTVLNNLLAVIAHKNVYLSQRAFHVSPKTIRGKVLAYLSSESARAHSLSFTIPFTRQELANYLGVDRSALSAELSKMQRDGLINTTRSFFELLT